MISIFAHALSEEGTSLDMHDYATIALVVIAVIAVAYLIRASNKN